MGLINQATDRAPVWLIKKLTATYLTLGLGDIGHQVGIDSPEEVRDIILSMVCLPYASSRTFQLQPLTSPCRSSRGRSTGASPPPTPSRSRTRSPASDQLDCTPVAVQENGRVQLDTAHAFSASKEYLT